MTGTITIVTHEQIIKGMKALNRYIVDPQWSDSRLVAGVDAPLGGMIFLPLGNMLLLPHFQRLLASTTDVPTDRA